jgi:hypothetical protein
VRWLVLLQLLWVEVVVAWRAGAVAALPELTQADLCLCALPLTLGTQLLRWAPLWLEL